MASVGEQLRAGRESQKLSVYQVAEITKIRTDHIRALEEGSYDVFSATVYIRGFVRTYAALLKLNVPRLLDELDEELDTTEKFSEPPPLTEERSGALDFVMLILSKLDWRKGMILLGLVFAVVVLFATVALIRHVKSIDPLEDLGEGMYQPPTNTFSGDVLPLPLPSTNRP